MRRARYGAVRLRLDRRGYCGRYYNPEKTLPRKKDIQWYQRPLPYNTGIASDDFCTILSNLLDNCLEAMDRKRRQRGEQPPEGAIQLTLRRINHFILIQASNPCPDIRIKRKGFFPTSKKNKLLHGWGLKSVEAAVRKYEGTFHCEVSEGRFTASAMLFFPETNGKAESLMKK